MTLLCLLCPDRMDQKISEKAMDLLACRLCFMRERCNRFFAPSSQNALTICRVCLLPPAWWVEDTVSVLALVGDYSP